MQPYLRGRTSRWFPVFATWLLVFAVSFIDQSTAILARSNLSLSPTKAPEPGLAARPTAAIESLLVPPIPNSDPLWPAQTAPILGAALTIIADGTAPWEDRPILVPGLGTLPGKYGVADPGDDTGPADRVVRSWDAIFYRVSFSVRAAPVDDLVVEVVLTGPAVWESARVAALRLSGCPGGATLLEDGRRLRCVVGHVDAPPAVTMALDLTARVSEAALQGDTIAATVSVRAPGIMPDREKANCPVPRADGCDASAPNVTVSAAPAVELRKYLVGVATTDIGGVAGRQLTWRLDTVAGADGDIRGTSSPVGAPWPLPDWWRATDRSGRTVELPIQLVGCTILNHDTDWTCTQPGGAGQPLEVAIVRLGEPTGLADGVTSSLPQIVGSLQLDLWVPETEVLAAGWDVTLQNCFATLLNDSTQATWAPVDARGQPNLGGITEPPANNCAVVVLPVPRPSRVPRRPPPPPPGPPPTARPPPARPTPDALVTKRYTPYTLGDAVTAGTEFAAEVAVRTVGGRDLAGVIACDKWDNSTHSLRDGGVAGVRVWWQAEGGPPESMDPAGVVVEYGSGRWGRKRNPGDSVGRGWYVQATATCGDAVAERPAGWVTADQVDFGNLGRRTIDAGDVNMIRARFTDPVPVGIDVWVEVLFTAGRNRSGTWLMNYAAAAWGSGSGSWHAEPCFGAPSSGSLKPCPVPVAGARGRPGSLGDMLVQVGVPVWVTKHNDPIEPGGSPVVNAGQTAAFLLEASTFPRPDDPPSPPYPPGAFASAVVVTDTLPAGMVYEPGSATIASEDLNADGVLDPAEDRNSNGRIDRDVPFEPTIRLGPAGGTTTLQWLLGDLPVQRRAPAIRFTARVSRLVRAGTSLTNWAGAAQANDRPPACGPRPPAQCRVCPFVRTRYMSSLAPSQAVTDTIRGLCAWAQVLVANTAAAQVEKLALAPSVRAGEAMAYRLGLANLTNRPVEWFDAVDILPRAGEPRDPESRIAGGIADVQVAVAPGSAPMEVWASAADPDRLDTAGGGLRDGLVDPVTAWGDAGAGLGGVEWPCRLADVGTRRCGAIGARATITALRLWGPDPAPRRSGTASDSFLPPDSPPRYVDVTLLAPGSAAGDVAHNAWGGRFEGLPLPVFDAALIRVRSLTIATATAHPTSTATPEPPTATATVTATPMPTRTAPATTTATGTRTPTPPRGIFLPVAQRHSCAPRPVDIVLVIDVSTSMLRPAGDGGSKLDAVLRAARAFLSRVASEHSDSRVALAAFNGQAWVVQPLTGDSSRLDAALDTLPALVGEGTRLDLGLQVGASALADAQPRRWRAMVFLTDGMPNWVPTPVGGGRQEDTVLAAAAAVRTSGILIHTVGYGRADAADPADRISSELLRAIAGFEAGYHETDDAGVLADVFREIATALGCSPEAIQIANHLWIDFPRRVR